MFINLYFFDGTNNHAWSINMKKLTKHDLINGRDFWIWALNNPTKAKSDYPKYDKIKQYHSGCPWCEIHCKDKDENMECIDCPLKVKYDANCFQLNSPYSYWDSDFYSIETIKLNIQKIIDVYQEEIGKCSGKMVTV